MSILSSTNAGKFHYQSKVTFGKKAQNLRNNFTVTVNNTSRFIIFT